jgi:hypothetical protein
MNEVRLPPGSLVRLKTDPTRAAILTREARAALKLDAA